MANVVIFERMRFRQSMVFWVVDSFKSSTKHCFCPSLLALGLPYYAGMPGVPSAFQYGPTVFVPPASAKQPAMGLANPSSQYHQQHQPSYGQHAYGAGGTYLGLFFS